MTDDEQEAKSVKYNVCRIVRLSSGNLALFNPFTNQSGLPLVAIGPDAEILPQILTAEQVDQYHIQWERDEMAERRRDILSKVPRTPTVTPTDDLI